MHKLITIAIILAACGTSPGPNRAIDFASRLDKGASCTDWGTRRGVEDADNALCTSAGILHWCHVDATGQPRCLAIADLNPKPVGQPSATVPQVVSPPQPEPARK